MEMSKSMEKKIAKRARLEEVKQLKKARKKQLKKEKKEEKLAQIDQGLVAPEELALMREKAAEFRENKINRKRQARERLEAAASDPNSVRIAIDLDFEEYMKEGELRSLSSQLNFCYGCNSKSTSPVSLSLVGMKENGFIDTHLNTKLAGFNTWVIGKHHKSVFDIYPKEEIVYLSAEADDSDILEDLDPSKVYVIGGIVDHNKHKGLSHSRATAANVATKKFLIPSKFVGVSRRVLAVNHVLQILVHFNETKDWMKAFELAIPSRKRPESK